jgi:hypothetical protein
VTNSISNADFLQAIFDDIPDDESVGVCLFEESPEDRKAWPVYDTRRDDVQAAMLERGNAFYCISTLERQDTLRRRQSTLKATYVIPLDDIGTGAGAKAAPEDVPVEPTYSIETSPGNFQYGYVLEEPIEDIAVATALIKTIAQIADTGAAIPNKLIRLPIGLNSKAKYGLPAPQTRLTHWSPGTQFTPEQLLDYWGVSEETFNQTVADCRGRERNRQARVNKEELRDDILQWLGHKDMLLSESPNPAGFYDVMCPWHETHTSGDMTGTGFSPIGAGGSEHEHTRQFVCLHDHCSRRGEGDLIAWMFNERFVYGTNDNTIYDKLNPEWRSKSIDHFKMAFAGHWFFVTDPETGKSKKFRAPPIWLENKDRINVEREVFIPDDKRMGVNANIMTGALEFNTHHPIHGRTYTESESLLGPVMTQLEYLFGSETDNALGFMAHTAHKPFNRLPFALLHIAPHHGTGRGWFKHLVSRMIGQRYYKNVSFQNFLHGNYNEFLSRSLIISFDEVYDQQNRFTVGERLRELITEDYIEVNVKYGFKGEMQVFPNCMFFSNHMDALKLPNRDRRFWVVACKDEPRSAAVYRELYGLLESQEMLDQFWSYLKRYLETSTFDATGRAPETEWKDAVQMASNSVDIEAPVKEILDELRVMGVKAVYRTQLVNDCRVNGADLPEPLPANMQSAKVFEAVLRDMGVERRGIRIVRRDNGRKEYVYFLRPMTGAGITEINDACEYALEHAKPRHNLTML